MLLMLLKASLWVLRAYAQDDPATYAIFAKDLTVLVFKIEQAFNREKAEILFQKEQKKQLEAKAYLQKCADKDANSALYSQSSFTSFQV